MNFFLLQSIFASLTERILHHSSLMTLMKQILADLDELEKRVESIEIEPEKLDHADSMIDAMQVSSGAIGRTFESWSRGQWFEPKFRLRNFRSVVSIHYSNLLSFGYKIC